VPELTEVDALVVVWLVAGLAVVALLVVWVVAVPWAAVTVVVEFALPQAASATAAAAAEIAQSRRTIVPTELSSPHSRPDPSICMRVSQGTAMGYTERTKQLLDPDAYVRAGEGFKAKLEKHDPFWGPQLVVAGAIVLDVSLPEKLTIGPTWLLPSVEGLLLAALLIASPMPGMRHSPMRRRLAVALIGLVSIVNLVSLYLLVHELLHHKLAHAKGDRLILAGVVLWVTNVLLFGLWYWELDRGGPIARATDPEAIPDFLFPQMTEPRYAPPGWVPELLDYLYVSLTNATAFSPTDTMPLTQIAKVLMSVQSLAALVTVGLVVARAINIL
jgi:hypothetical protein